MRFRELRRTMPAFSILRFFSTFAFALVQVAARFSEGCESVAELLQLNMSKILALSRKAARREEEMGYRDLMLFAPLLSAIQRKQSAGLASCPCAFAAAATVGISMEMTGLEYGAVRTNFDYMTTFGRLTLLENALEEALKLCVELGARKWPIDYAEKILWEIDRYVRENLQSIEAWVAESQEEVTITDEQHLDALADAAEVLGSEGLDWWPTRGTLIALLRHGRRSGPLSRGKLDVVDHDVDVMVGVSSEEEWVQRRPAIQQKLHARGWNACFERHSVAAPYGSFEYNLARRDLFLCTRTNPKVTLDIATYITEGPIAIAQKYCPGAGIGCWIPRNDGSFRGSQGRLRVSAIRPFGRCKAGDISVPCPRNPLETLRATTPINFTKNCVALPDTKQRLDRDVYESDKDPWLSEGLTGEDVDILRHRAAELDRDGYMS
ncbi:unnamed protein product, partial [Symbiodinium microadriaticum]